MKKVKALKNVIMLQFVIIIYSTTSIIAKFAAAQEVASFHFFLLFGLEIGILGIYAILWQQMIKKFDLSIAYANRAMELFWSLLWTIVIFQDKITLYKVGGVVLVIAGTILINSDQKTKEDTLHA